MRKPPHLHSGFTLLELLVAMTIASLLIAGLASALQAVSDVTRSTGGRIEAEREARAAFEMLERDLAAAVRGENGRIWDVEDPDPPPTGERPRWLSFLASPLDHDHAAPGDICLVSYRTGHEPLPGSDEPFPSLHRLAVPANETFEDALGRSPLDENFFTENADYNTASRALTSWLAAGVIDIEIRAWATESSGIETLEITLTVLDKLGQTLYATLPMEELKKRHAYRFTRKIPVPATSP